MYFVYVLLSLKVKKSYVGLTKNLNRRLEEHNAGENAYTKRYIPWKIIYKESCASRVLAREREKYFKSAAGSKFLRSSVFNDS